MRASRLLSIQMLLETRGSMSARALAEALEVSMRTLYRDVDQLAAAGVPIYAERGRNGGFKLLEGWKTTLTGLTPAEAQTVFMTGLAGPAAELGLGKHIEGARLKLLSSLPAPWRDDAQRVSSRFHLDPVEWYRESESTPHLATVAGAVWNERQLAMRYESWTDTAERVVSPLGLVLKAGAWYLVAVSGAGAHTSARTYRISSIQAATMLEAGVKHGAKRPTNFDLAAYWAQSILRFERELYKGRATLLATPIGLKRLAGLNSAVAKALAKMPAVPRKHRRSDGRVEVSIPIESIEDASLQLLRLATHVEVLQPAALRRAMIARLDEIGQLYGLQTQRAA
jgi:predicted DNA-binding transcriptional regulator YafY